MSKEMPEWEPVYLELGFFMQTEVSDPEGITFRLYESDKSHAIGELRFSRSTLADLLATRGGPAILRMYRRG